MSIPRSVIFGEDAARNGDGRAVLGGKAAALADLAGLDLRVPKWFCAPAALFADVHALVDRALTGASSARARSERARAVVRERGIDGETRGAILAAFDRTFAADAFVAVRSSAVGEDSARDSFAGQLDTFLFVRRDAVIDRVLDVVASAYSERALAYRDRRGVAPDAVRVAVLVQEMIDGRASGILFTANPTTSDRGEIVIAAGLGLGEGIVAGRVEADTLFLAKDDGHVRSKRIASKEHRVAFDARSGTAIEAVSGDAVLAPAISDDEARALHAIGRKIEAHFGVPQDIEWTIDASGGIHVLQARPITTLERETIFDSSNIVESFPGLTLPLTFTFARRSYEEAFREAQLRTGVPRATLDAHPDVHANLVGLVEGRVYYNILNWYRLFTWVPGFEGMLPAWEKALGIDRRFAPPGRPARGLADRLAQARVVETNLRSFLGLQRDVDAFLGDVTTVRAELAAIDLQALDAHELLDRLDAARRRLLKPFAVSVLNDLYAQQVYDRLAKLIAAWNLGDPSTLRNELLCGERGMESVAPVRSLVGIAKQVRDTPALARVFASGDDAHVLAALRDDPQLAPLRAAIAEHLRVYGDRTLEELKLETPPLADRPGFLVAMIRNYVRGRLDVASMEDHERAIRDAAEAATERALAGSPIRRHVFGMVLGAARRMVKNREALRLARSRAYGIVRALYRAIAAKLVARGALDEDADLFYLTIDEVEGAIRGSGVTTDLRALVRLRRDEYARFATTCPTPRVTVRGPVIGARVDREGPIEASDDGVLRGIACSPGRRRAPAKVVLDPEREPDLSGEILVAPMTDPAWAYLMASAGGLVAERGSILSHTAIIGRELGIPTVVGVPGATRVIMRGQTIEIDGSAGTVRLFADAPRAASELRE